MPVKKQTQKKIRKVSWRNVLTGALIAAVAVGILGQICFNRYVLTRLDGQDPNIRSLLVDAISSLNKEAVVDGPTAKVYLPEARLVLPPYSSAVSGLLYAYSPSDNTYQEEVRLTTQTAMQHGTHQIESAPTIDVVFDRVPEAQACSRQLLLTFGKGESGFSGEYTEVFAKQLQDGRTLYLHVAKKCQVGSEALIAYIRDIQSYTR